MNRLKNKLIFVVRHGERADLVENCRMSNLGCGIFDSELTEKGEKECYELGKRSRSFIEAKTKRSVEEISLKLVSSPFARTLITSKCYIKGLGVNIPINIDNVLCEKLNPKWYPTHPNEFLAVLRSNSIPNTMLKEQLEDVKIDINDYDRDFIKYPETPEDFYKRMETVLPKMRVKYLPYCDILIIVSHYLLCDYFAKKYGNMSESLKLEYGLTLAFELDAESKIHFIDFLH